MIQGTIKQFYQDHQVPNPINITLTQKQVVEGQRIDDLISEANIRHFRNLLNRRLFGNAYKRYGRQLSMLVIRETSAWQRHHIHAVIEKPDTLTTEEFIATVIQCWTKTKFGYARCVCAVLLDCRHFKGTSEVFEKRLMLDGGAFWGSRFGLARRSALRFVGGQFQN